jgi:hypothetical protein
LRPVDIAALHYPFELIRQVCTAVGASVERVADSANPRGESLLLITRGSARDGS